MTLAISLSSPGLASLELGVDGPFEIEEEIDLGTPESRHVWEPRTGASGTIDRTSHFGSRVLTAIVTDTNATFSDMTLLKAYTSPARNSVATISGLPKEAPTMAADVRGMGDRHTITRSDYIGGTGRHVVQWIVPAGVFRAVESQRFQLWPSSAIEVGGRTYDRIADREYPPVGFVGAVDVVNYGSATADPMIVIYGPITAPIVSDVSTGREYSFPTLTLAAGAHLQIDVANRTVRFNSDPADSRLKFKARGPWWGIEPWTQQLQLDGTGTTAQTNAVVTFADTYL